MSTLVIKNLPEPLHEALKERARQHHRSVTKETISLIEESVQSERRRAELPPPIKLKSGHMLTIEEIEAAIAEGQE